MRLGRGLGVEMKRDAGRKCVFKRGTIALGGGSPRRKKDEEREHGRCRA